MGESLNRSFIYSVMKQGCIYQWVIESLTLHIRSQLQECFEKHRC